MYNKPYVWKKQVWGYFLPDGLGFGILSIIRINYSQNIKGVQP